VITSEISEQQAKDNEAYERLAEALDKLPNGFPQTPARLDLKILKKIFSPEETALAGQLSGHWEDVEEIAKRIGLTAEDTAKKLAAMVPRGMVRLDQQTGASRYRLAPFLVGFYEAQLKLMDHELAHLVEDYFANGGAAGIMKPEPAHHRVIPAQQAVKSEWILPYDDVRAILQSAKVFHIQDCICRVQQAQIGHKCEFPANTCLSFSNLERPPVPGDITQAEALALLDKLEEAGLVHAVSNIMSFGYICNCCGCCCAILRGITVWGIEKSVAAANYYADIDPALCVGCGICRDRCQVHAIANQDGVSVVTREKCIGCGLCVTGCPNSAAILNKKPEAEIVTPPADFATWEHARLHNRGLVD